MTNERLQFLKNKYASKLDPNNVDMSLVRGGHGPGRGGMSKGKPKNVKATVGRLFSYIGNQKIKLIIVVICTLLNSVFSLAASYMLRPVINNLTQGDDRVTKLIQGLLAMVLIYLCGVVAQYIQQRIMIGVSQNAIMQLRKDLFNKLQTLPVRYYDSNNNGDIMSRFTNDVDAIGEMLNSTVIQLVSGIISIIGTLALMIYTNWILTLITIVMMPLMLAALKAITSKSSKYYRAQQAAIGTLNGYIEETMNGQKVVKVFNHEEGAKEEFEYLNHDLRSKQIKAIFFGGIMGPVMGNIGQISYALTACIGGILCVARGFDVGGMTIFVNYSRQFSMPINQIAMQVNTIFAALAGAERVFAVMDEKPEVVDDENCVRIVNIDEIDVAKEYAASVEKNDEYKEKYPDGNKSIYQIPKNGPFVEKFGAPSADELLFEDKDNYYKDVKGAVTLKDVNFGYVPEKTVLTDISLYAKPGQKIAFVGSTGAGKTTITNLINRFYDVNDGEVLIDGIPVKMIGLADLRRNIAMVLQDTHLFTGSVMENIRYGRLDATDEEVIEAAKTASAHSFIIRLENGYDTILEGDGANLSQGQRQLINIARAAISKAPILILDEATSSVDTRTEKHIEHGMDRLMANRTTLVIAHRLSTVRNSNAIMVLEYGKIIERGDHDDLLAQQGRYYELYTGKSELS